LMAKQGATKVPTKPVPKVPVKADPTQVLLKEIKTLVGAMTVQAPEITVTPSVAEVTVMQPEPKPRIKKIKVVKIKRDRTERLSELDFEIEYEKVH